MNEIEREIGRALLAAERRIALLDRLRPTRGDGGLGALESALARGVSWTPELPRRADLGDLADELAALATATERAGPRGPHFATRARELGLEAELACHIGTPRFRELAALRFDAGPELAAASALAEAWADLAVPRDDAAAADSDDRGHPASLYSCIEAELARGAWTVRIEVVAGLASLAAVGDGVVKIRARARLSERAARRLALHEVRAHVAPRENARLRADWLGRVGVAGAGEIEEGRGLWLEERAGLLDADRRRELAQRHLACAALRDGAEPVEVARTLVARGAERGSAARIVVRATRGLGLCREIVYLPAFLRVSHALARAPELDAVLERGRWDLDLARELAAEPDLSR